MIKHFIAAAALAGCSMVASVAYAGSPYYADPTDTVRPTASHALGTSHTGEAWANAGYAATASDESFGSAAAPAAPARWALTDARRRSHGEAGAAYGRASAFCLSTGQVRGGSTARDKFRWGRASNPPMNAGCPTSCRPPSPRPLRLRPTIA